MARIAVSIVPSTGFFTARYGCVARRAECLCEVVALRQRVGCAADDLREDHPRVAARAHQRGPRHLVREARTVVRPVLVQRSSIARTVNIRFVPVSPSGTG